MGDQPPPATTMSSSNELTSNGSSGSPASPTGSDNTVTQPQPSPATNSEPQLGQGSAMFSTDLGMCAPRRLQGPGYPSVVVKSDKIYAVATAAGHWRAKYPYQYMCILPQGKWQIGDLWDEEDIYIDTASFCKAVLSFIEQDNCIRAKKYAHEWSKQHLERLFVLGGDMSELYNKANPLSIVHKIFTTEERQLYPPIFLWHVAHIMRVAMLAVKGVKLPAKVTGIASERPNVDNENVDADGAARDPKTAESSAMPHTVPSSMALPSLTHVAKPATSMNSPRPMPSFHAERPPPSQRFNAPQAYVRLANSVEGDSYAEPMTHILPHVPEHQMGGANLGQSGLHVPKTRPGRPASGTYPRMAPMPPYVENMPRLPSVHGPRQYASSVLHTQSPRLNQAHMALTHPMVNMHQGAVPFGYDQTPMALGMIASQPHAVMLNEGVMPHAMQNSSMAHGYPRQPSSPQGPPYVAPMGDMTNMRYAQVYLPGHVDVRRPGDRRYNQQHGPGSALYDPYEGSNPAFRAGVHPNGKRQDQNGVHTSNGRQRKASAPGNRPHHAQYISGRPGYVHSYGNRNPGPKGPREYDPAITQDPEAGCNFDWIGPQNETVNELFVKDLPEDIRDTELEALFHGRIGVKPVAIKIASASQPHYNLQGRKHAFIGFTTTAFARQAMSIPDPAIRGLPVSITVPKRFFQKIVEVSQGGATEAGPSGYSRYTSDSNIREARSRLVSANEGDDVELSAAVTQETLSYSPQDVRSDLHKRKIGKQPHQGPTAVGSPEARKSKLEKRSEEPSPENSARSTGQFVHSTLEEATVTKGLAPIDDTTTTTLTDCEPRSTQLQASGSSSKPDENASPSTAEDSQLVHGPARSECTSGATNDMSIPATDQQQKANPQQMVSQPQQGSHAVELPRDSTKEVPIEHARKVAKTDVNPTMPAALGIKQMLPDYKLKHDTSFHSAEESQSNLDTKVVSSGNLDTVSQGDPMPLPEAIAERAMNSTQSTPTNSTTHAAPEEAIASSTDTTTPAKDTVVPAAASTESSTENSKAASIVILPFKPAQASAGMQDDTVPFTSSNAAPGPTKKSGPQQTESLTPFGAKKNRKKKVSKKGKEQVKKARAMKIAASKATMRSGPVASDEVHKECVAGKSTPAEGTQGTIVFETAAKNLISTAAPDLSTLPWGVQDSAEPIKVPVSAAKASLGTVDGRDKSNKRRGEQAAIASQHSAAATKCKDDDHGKHASGLVSTRNETDSMTNKDANLDLTEGELSLDAQSSKPEGNEEAPGGAKESNSAVAPALEPQSSKKKNKKKKKKASPKVWPDLEFPPMSPNPEFMGPIDMASDVQNYDMIMNEACGGEENPDFSWNDLPKMVPFQEGQQGLVSDSGEGDGVSRSDPEGEAILTGIADFETQHAMAKLDREMQGLGQALFPKISKMQPELASKITVKLLEGYTNAGIARLLSDEPALRIEVAQAASTLTEQLQNNNGSANTVKPVETGITTAASQEAKISLGPAKSQTRIDTTTKEPNAATVDLAVAKKQVTQRGSIQEPSNTTKLAKKKTQSKNKKQQQPDTAGRTSETSEAFNTGDATGITKVKVASSKATTEDQIDSNDPFREQLMDVEVAKRGLSESTNAQRTGSQNLAGVSDSFMRAMESYIKETQGHGRSKGPKLSKEDGQ